MAVVATTVNYWPSDACAKAFWGQSELPAYRRLLADTAVWLDPRAGERWLDLGCGGGQLTRTLWERSAGSLAEVVALDCAAANGRALAKLCATLRPRPEEGQVRFLHADFSAGLALFPDRGLDGVVSGLAVQYAESYAPDQGRWTADAYEHLLAEVYRVLRPGGRFVFSVNVPDPAWGKLALSTLPGIFGVRRPLRYLKNALRMWRYGSWLQREARRGRFHFLPAALVTRKLAAAGFDQVEHRLSYAGLAFVLRCRRP
jgi:ubiquinone/menaquinone biosynthesis C-methylase UbiE